MGVGRKGDTFWGVKETSTSKFWRKDFNEGGRPSGEDSVRVFPSQVVVTPDPYTTIVPTPPFLLPHPSPTSPGRRLGGLPTSLPPFGPWLSRVRSSEKYEFFQSVFRRRTPTPSSVLSPVPADSGTSDRGWDEKVVPLGPCLSVPSTLQRHCQYLSSYLRK